MFPSAAIDTDSEDIWGSCIHDTGSVEDVIPEVITEPCSKCEEVLHFEYVPHASILNAFNKLRSSHPDGQADSWGATPLPNQWGAMGVPFNAVIFHDRKTTLEIWNATDTSKKILRRHMFNPTDAFRNWLKRFTGATTFWPFHKVYQIKKVDGVMYRRLIQTLDWTWEDIQTLFANAEDSEWERYDPEILFPYIGNYKLLKNLYGNEQQSINYKHIK